MNFQMSLATLSERLEFDTAERATWADVARNPTYTLVDKFDIINSCILAEPLGDCGLKLIASKDAGLALSLYILESYRSYQFSENYSKMVSRRDMALINSKLKRFTLTRAIKHCNVFRFLFDDKPYTWDLVLAEISRHRLHMGPLV